MNIKGLMQKYSDPITAEEAKKYCIISDYDFDLIFDVVADKNGKYIFNLNQTVYFEFDELDIKYTRTDQDEMSWPLISYRLYNTTNFAWLLMKLNNASPQNENLFIIQNAGTIVKYLDNEKLNNIVEILANMNDESNG